MPRILIVAQATGSIGKTTVTRGLAEAAPDAPVFEIESNKRILEYDHGRAQGSLRVTHFPVRAEREDVETSGSQRAIDGAAVMFALPARACSHTAWLDSVSHIAISANFPPAGKPGFASGHFNPSHH